MYVLLSYPIQVFQLMETIEVVTRQFLNVSTVHSYNLGTDIRKQIYDSAVSNRSIIGYWDTISRAIPHQYEKYRLSLLSDIIDLWITIRGHSFVRDWTMKFETKFKKGTRTSLLPKT